MCVPRRCPIPPTSGSRYRAGPGRSSTECIKCAIVFVTCAAVQWPSASPGDRLQHPQQPENPRTPIHGRQPYIARQDKKPYDSAEPHSGISKAVQPELTVHGAVPAANDCKRMFMVNGHLLPGYTLAPPERTKEEAVKDLLDMSWRTGRCAAHARTGYAVRAPKQKSAAVKPVQQRRRRNPALKKSGPVR